MAQPVPIPGYEGRYDIHPDGRVWSHRGKGKFLKLNNVQGYHSVSLCAGGGVKPVTRRVHIIAAAAYIPNPDGKPFIDHIDRDRANNSLDNLRWVTKQENNQNKTAHRDSGTGVVGVRYRSDLVTNPWIAQLSTNGKTYLEKFRTEAEAVACRRAMELAHFIPLPSP